MNKVMCTHIYICMYAHTQTYTSLFFYASSIEDVEYQDILSGFTNSCIIIIMTAMIVIASVTVLLLYTYH